jgi:LytS/YehU family sensor histidine kinase
LSSLIRISPEKAIDFVDKFSKIYRYVLDVNEKIVVELRDEMDFLQSFYFLHKIRFGENLEIIVEIESSYLSKLIPPLSLQILVENAIKHNEISGEHPLKIMIFVTAEYLVISNNLQLKKNMEGSTGIGLNNLTQRYEHLTEFKPKFYATHDEYIAMIPLLNE